MTIDDSIIRKEITASFTYNYGNPVAFIGGSVHSLSLAGIVTKKDMSGRDIITAPSPTRKATIVSVDETGEAISKDEHHHLIKDNNSCYVEIPRGFKMCGDPQVRISTAKSVVDKLLGVANSEFKLNHSGLEVKVKDTTKGKEVHLTGGVSFVVIKSMTSSIQKAMIVTDVITLSVRIRIEKVDKVIVEGITMKSSELSEALKGLM